MYWGRQWRVQYQANQFTLTPNVGAAQSVTLTGNLAQVQGPESATYSGQTSDGRAASVTVSRAGSILALSLTGQGNDLRCGAATAGVAAEGIVTVPFGCMIGLVDEPQTFVTTVNIDRSSFPWRTLSGPDESLLVTDPGGSLVGAAQIESRPNADGTGDLQVRIGSDFQESEATYYRFLPNGDLQYAGRPNRHASPALLDTVCTAQR